MTPTIYYCYDAYCGWCYGFSPVIEQLWKKYNHSLAFDVLSGGMILPDTPAHIGVMAPMIAQEYKRVEEYSDVVFGPDYLWHIHNPDKSDWYPHSLKPAIALCILKSHQPGMAVPFAASLQKALHLEGRDLTDDEAYRHLLPEYKLPTEEFYTKLHSPEFTEKAQYDFALCRQLQVTGYPCVLVQVSHTKLYMIARGYTPFETLEQNLLQVLKETGNAHIV